ncbi:26S proteasome complex subunit SEM1 [Chlorella vulgaris]
MKAARPVYSGCLAPAGLLSHPSCSLPHSPPSQPTSTPPPDHRARRRSGMANPQQDAIKRQEQIEEDEFEEFEVEDWDSRDEDPQNQQLWEQDWDDDNIDDDFSQRLKAELERQMQQKKQEQQPAPETK